MTIYPAHVYARYCRRLWYWLPFWASKGKPWRAFKTARYF
jgi:hypothetical protein